MCAWNSSNTLLISAYLMALDGNKRILKWIYLFSATSKLPWNNKNSYPLQHYFYSMKSLDFWVPTTLFFKKFLCPLPPTTIFWVEPPPPYNILDNNTAPPNFKNGTALIYFMWNLFRIYVGTQLLWMPFYWIICCQNFFVNFISPVSHGFRKAVHRFF